MDLLSEYDSCRHRILSLQQEQEDNYLRLDELDARMSQIAMSKRAMASDLQYNLDSVTRQQLEKLISQRRTELRIEIESLEQQVAKLEAESLEKCKAVAKAVNARQFPKELVAIQNADKILNSGTEIMESVASKAIIASVENALVSDTKVYDLEALSSKVRRNLENVPDTLDVSIFSKIINGMLLSISEFENWKPRVRICIYIAYICIFLLIFKVQPAILYLPYSLMLLGSVISNITRSKKLVDFVYPYKLLENRKTQVEQEISQQVEHLRSIQYHRITAERDSLIFPIQRKLEEVRRKINQVEAEVRAGTSTTDLTASAKADYTARMAVFDEETAAGQKDISRTHKFITSNDTQLEKTLKHKETLKSQVVDNYLNPKEPGNSKLLTRSFFLGLDDKEELIEFKYDGLSTLILYKGDDNSVNSPLITMMLMQLLSSMSIVALRIAVTDTRAGCIDFAVFAPAILSQRIKMCAVTEDVKKVIETYHNDFRMRNKDILTEAPSIDDYNRHMIEKRSLTREYCLLFLQDPDIKTLADQKLLQLCMSGPRVGIIPIIFFNHRTLNEILKSGKKEDLTTLRTFLDAMGSKLFIFNGDTQDLDESTTLKERIINQIKGGLAL